MTGFWPDFDRILTRAPFKRTPKRAQKRLKNHDFGRILTGFWQDFDLILTGFWQDFDRILTGFLGPAGLKKGPAGLLKDPGVL